MISNFEETYIHVAISNTTPVLYTTLPGVWRVHLLFFWWLQMRTSKSRFTRTVNFSLGFLLIECPWYIAFCKECCSIYFIHCWEGHDKLSTSPLAWWHDFVLHPTIYISSLVPYCLASWFWVLPSFLYFSLQSLTLLGLDTNGIGSELLALWLWGSYSTSPRFSFFVCEIVIIIYNSELLWK